MRTTPKYIAVKVLRHYCNITTHVKMCHITLCSVTFGEVMRERERERDYGLKAVPASKAMSCTGHRKHNNQPTQLIVCSPYVAT